MNTIIKRLGISSTNASREVASICDRMYIECARLMEENKIAKIDFTKFPKDTFIKPEVDTVYGVINGMEFNENNVLIFVTDCDSKVFFDNCHFLFNDIFNILYCVESCVAVKNRKNFTEMGIIVKK